MILQGISLALGVLSGFGKVETAKKVSKSKSKQLEFKTDYNKKKIDEALEENYVKLISSYTNQKSELLIDRSKGDNKARLLATQGVGDIDVLGSSVFTTANAQLDNEFQTNLNLLNDWKSNQALDLELSAINKKLGLDMAEIDAQSQINQQENAAIQAGYTQVVDGIMSGVELYQDYRTNKKAGSAFEASVGNYSGSVLSGNQYFPDYSSSQAPRTSTAQNSIRNFGLNTLR